MMGLQSSSTGSLPFWAGLCSNFEKAFATERTSGKLNAPRRNAAAGENAVTIAALMGSARPKMHSSRNMSVLKFTMATMSKNPLV